MKEKSQRQDGTVISKVFEWHDKRSSQEAATIMGKTVLSSLAPVGEQTRQGGARG